MQIRGFEFPDALYYHVEHQVWAALHGDGTATVGITALGVHLSGEIYMCRPKSVSTEVKQGRSIAVVELAKAIVSVKSPVTGTVIAVNPLLAATPELVHQSPYDKGWLAKVRLNNFALDAPALRNHSEQDEQLVKDVEHYAWLNQLS